MEQLTYYHLNDDTSMSRFGSLMKFNRVLYGGHNNDGRAQKFFTFAGDAPIVMGANSDYMRNNWCYQAKRGVLQSGLALTAAYNGERLPSWQSRWFHKADDLISTWRHGYMEYAFSRVSSYFPETQTKIEVYPLQEYDGYLVHYDVIADGEVIFVAVLGGMTDFIGRFDNTEAPAREFSPSDCKDSGAVVTDNLARITYGKDHIVAGSSFGAVLKADGADAAFEPELGRVMYGHDGAPAVVKFHKHLAAGERLSGNIVVIANGGEETLNNYLERDPREALKNAIAAKTNGIRMATPDKRLDASVRDMQIALDASYHAPTFFHGAIGYHSPFLGWRGWYGATLAGWFERVRSATRAHIATMLHSDKPERVWWDGSDRPDLDHEGTQYHHLENTHGRMTALLFMDDIHWHPIGYPRAA